jgi:subtilisin family serine protease
MEPCRAARKQFDINGAPARWIAVTVLALAAAQPVRAQLLDTTVDDLVTGQIERQVTDQVAEQLTNAVQQHVEQEVESAVADAVEQQVAADVATTVEQAIEGEVVESVRQQVEAGVVDLVEQQVESRVTEAVGERLEDRITGAVESAVGDVLDDAAAAGRVLADGTSSAAEGVRGAADRGRGRGRRRGEREQRDSRRTAAFVAGVDAAGRAVERETWVILVPAQYAERIAGWGFTIRERSDLASLDRVLLRVDAPEDRDIAQAALELALDAPGTLVDFNHLYRAGAEPAPSGFAGRPAARAVEPARLALPGVAIGLIDSAVATGHEALRAAQIEQRDFVPYSDARPLEHGTAVASIIVGESKTLRPLLPGARLYAASVFFADDAGHPVAATASLVEALDWLAASAVRTVNMSLAGPPNKVLEGAVKETVARGAVVVAAVGNNGPVGEPLYPAAYPSVVGITAVDAANRIYRYANRGRQVTFAAPGVKVRVARSAGGYGVDSGTSLAAPYAAAIVASSLALKAQLPADEVVAALESAAIDLGDQDFDEVFGYGLIAALP